MLKLLLENGDVKNSPDKGLFDCAVVQKFFTAIPMLVRFGADINAHNKYGYTSLMVASMHSGLEAMSCLFLNGARVDTRDSKRPNALFYACRFGNDQVVKELLRHGVQVDLQDDKGWTVIDVAKKYKQETILEIFEDFRQGFVCY